MTVTCDPTYPVVGDTVTLTQTIGVIDEDDDGDEINESITIENAVYTLTAVPAESALETGMLVDDNGDPTDEFEPDVEGAYVVTAQAYWEYRAAPEFDEDPAGQVRAVASTSESFTVRVGVSMDFPIATMNGHNVTLRLKSHNGVVTDASFVTPLTQVALAATEDTTVLTKLAALETVAVTALGPDIASVTNELATKYAAHRIEGTIHASDDTVNVFVWDRPYSVQGAIERLNLFREVFVRHLLGASNSSLVWHTDDDTKNVPIVGFASNVATAIVLYSDLRRCYDAHRTQISAPASHSGSGDTVNTLATASTLVDLISTYLAFVAAASPTTPTNFESGMLKLQSMYGFIKTPT